MDIKPSLYCKTKNWTSLMSLMDKGECKEFLSFIVDHLYCMNDFALLTWMSVTRETIYNLNVKKQTRSMAASSSTLLLYHPLYLSPGAGRASLLLSSRGLSGVQPLFKKNKELRVRGTCPIMNVAGSPHQIVMIAYFSFVLALATLSFRQPSLKMLCVTISCEHWIANFYLKKFKSVS